MESNAEQLVTDFLSEYSASGGYSRDHIARLAGLVTAEDASTVESATRAFFTALVERLADSFEPDAVSLYNRAFTQLIQACRRDARAAQIDQQLEAYGLRSEEDLVARAEYLRQVRVLPNLLHVPPKIKQIIILSRVTLGADIAITSVIIERMKLRFPAAEIVLVGGTKMPELFGGDPRVSFRQIGYRRTATTIERLLTWIELLRCLRDLTSALSPGEYLIVDPDSRLTQLGLLPVVWPEEAWQGREQDPATLRRDYLFFPSREYGSGTSLALSQLSSLWLDEVFGESAPTHPSVSLRRSDIDAARKLVTGMRRGSRPIIAISFGVGDNERKRVSGEFETLLITRLVREGAAVILDKGAGPNEIAAADALIADVTQVECDGRPARVFEIDEQSLTTAPTPADLDILVWNGRIGLLAALIGECDLYIGYDSAGGHIATGLGIPSVDVFAGFRSMRFVARWRPTGKAVSRIVAVDTLGGHGLEEVLSDVLMYSSEILKRSFQG